MQSLPKQYEPKEAEKRWQLQWLETQVYRFQNDLPREQSFIIDTPPPTVSGLLHMGHVFSYCQADFVARYQRMSGKDVCYPIGFDDNGLPTERLVEKIKGKKASQYPSREAFIEDCKTVVSEAEEEFRCLFKSIALSIDWNKEYQTVSPQVQALSQASFLELMAKGQAYRDFRPTYWDWVDQTAIAQAEIENKDMPGVMNDIQFTLEDGTPITIATTRPELLGACVAVMYHPEDPKASTYAGKQAITPLFGVKVPMIPDELVERDKGTGLVMCCTFGDDTDKEWVRQHELPWRPLIDVDGKLRLGSVKGNDASTEAGITFRAGKDGAGRNFSALTLGNCIDVNAFYTVFAQLEGLKPKQANAKIIELLQAAGLILKQTPMTHAVKCAERSGTPIEIIPTHQWFVRVVDKKEALLARAAECDWNPDYMRIRINQWIEGLKEDWCISRQRFFGVPFPVWYSKRPGEEGKIVLANPQDLPVDPLTSLPAGYTADEVQADRDVMDTWATSSLTPQITAGTLTPGKLFPADLRPQAHEIIRSWAFYTIVKAHLHGNCIPWKNLMISGWCLAADKTKMSKSKGNVVTPVALIEEKGADAVRYWASTSRLGADTAFSEDALKIGRKLVTKLWNAANFVALQLEKLPAPPTVPAAKDTAIVDALDVWIISRLHAATATATEEFGRFEYCAAREAVEAFFWKDFCDNYLELVKARAYEGNLSALHTLHHCLDGVLRLFAPFVPHVTEEIYHHLFNQASIHRRGNWPKAGDYPVNEAAEIAGAQAVDVLNAIRKAKSEAGVSIKFPVERVVLPNETLALIAPLLEDVKSAGNVTGDIIAGPVLVVQLGAKESAA